MPVHAVAERAGGERFAAFALLLAAGEAGLGRAGDGEGVVGVVLRGEVIHRHCEEGGGSRSCWFRVLVRIC